MPNILEELRTRIVQAEKRVNEAGVQLQAADKAYNAAVAELHVWRSALDAETRSEHARQEAAKSDQPSFAGMEPVRVPNTLEAVTGEQEPLILTVAANATVSINKTEMVRTLLRQNPAGLTPPQIWEHVSGEFKHRPYLYSVLKRLKDHDEVVTRRDKYLLRSSQEVNQILTLQ